MPRLQFLIAVSSVALLAGCGRVEQLAKSDNVSSAVIRGQVALKEAADNTRDRMEEARAAEAENAVNVAKGDGTVGDDDGPPQQAAMGERYVVREVASGYYVVDSLSGSTVEGEHGPLRGLPQEDAEAAAAKLNKANAPGDSVRGLSGE